MATESSARHLVRAAGVTAPSAGGLLEQEGALALILAQTLR